MTKNVVLKNEQDQQKILAWWSGLVENRPWKAELRRAEKPEDVLLTKAFRALYYDMAGTRWIKDENIIALAAAAGILAHVDKNNSQYSFAESCARPRPSDGSEKASVSELRFSQLQKSSTIDELFVRMRRAIHILEKNGNVLSIADSVFLWCKEMIHGKPESEPRNRIRVRWGLEYFQHLPSEQKQ